MSEPVHRWRASREMQARVPPEACGIFDRELRKDTLAPRLRAAQVQV